MNRLSLFEGFGIEIEYMIVDCDTLNVSSISDKLLESVHGKLESELEMGALCWSNELVLHVLELKTNGPAARLDELSLEFHKGLLAVNERLAQLNARLMPTAMHPWMEPIRETKLWPHDNNEIYEAFNRIFSCQGHGWSNLQSMHVNLPFANDKEFASLHSAIRFLLPLLPAVAASSPVVEKRLTGTMDNRLLFYEQNQKSIPLIAGAIVPEPIRSGRDYQEKIFEPIFAAIRPFDPQGILQHEWLNSRGAIARFDRHAIEIRVLDVQECPRADIAIAALIVAALKFLINQQTPEIPTDRLKAIFDLTAQTADQAVISDREFLRTFGLSQENVTASEIWRHLFYRCLNEMPDSPLEIRETIASVLQHGPLARRLTNHLKADASNTGLIPASALQSLYSRLCVCLADNQLFLNPA